MLYILLYPFYHTLIILWRGYKPVFNFLTIGSLTAALLNFFSFQNEDDNGHLAYWLTNTSALLFLLQKSLKTGGTGATASKKPPITTSLFGRMALVC